MDEMEPIQTVNINVLRRYIPNIVHIHDSTSYVVLYRFSHGAWSKTGMEGSLWIYQKDTEPYCGVFVLNRQGLENFDEPLVERWDADLDNGLVIWRNESATGNGDDDVIHGIWVYEADHRERITECMQALIQRDEAMHREETPAPPSMSHPVPRVPILPGQSITVEELFGLANSVSEPPPVTSALPLPGAHSQTDSDIYNLERQVRSPDPSELPQGMQLLDNLFQKAGLKQQPPPPPPQQPPPTQATPTAQSPQQESAQRQQPQQAQQARPRRNSSTDDREPTYQPATAYGHPLPAPAQSGAGHYNQGQGRGNSHSRRSSGSSDHRHRADRDDRDGRTDKPAGPPQGAQMVPAPVPVMDPQEARMGILGMIGHPAAAGGGTGSAPSSATQGSPGGTSYGNGYRPQQPYVQPQPYGAPQHQQFGVPQQQYAMQPQQAGGYGVTQGGQQNRNTPPSGYGPITHSQYEKQFGVPHPQAAQQPQPMQDPGSPGGRHKAYGPQGWNPAHNDLPKRALSPLNPAAQANGTKYQAYNPSVTNGRSGGAGAGRGQSQPPAGQYGSPGQGSQGRTSGNSGGGGGGTGGGVGGGDRSGAQPYPPQEYTPQGPPAPVPLGPGSGSYGSPTSAVSPNGPAAQGYNSPGSYGAPAYNPSSSQGSYQSTGGGQLGAQQQGWAAPQVNDSSRPRQGSQGSTASHHAHGQGGKGISPKWAADAMDEALRDVGGPPGRREDGEEGSLERREFREAVIQMLQTNSHFLDHVYSKYLGRRAAEGWS